MVTNVWETPVQSDNAETHPRALCCEFFWTEGGEGEQQTGVGQWTKGNSILLFIFIHSIYIRKIELSLGIFLDNSETFQSAWILLRNVVCGHAVPSGQLWGSAVRWD